MLWHVLQQCYKAYVITRVVIRTKVYIVTRLAICTRSVLVFKILGFLNFNAALFFIMRAKFYAPEFCAPEFLASGFLPLEFSAL